MKIRKFEKLVISICMLIIVSLALVTTEFVEGFSDSAN